MLEWINLYCLRLKAIRNSAIELKLCNQSSNTWHHFDEYNLPPFLVQTIGKELPKDIDRTTRVYANDRRGASYSGRQCTQE